MPEEQKVIRKLRAILSADVKGYSLLMADDEVHTIQTLKMYRQIMSGIITQHSGRVVDNPGDNLLAEFSSAVDAVECAAEVQKKLTKENAKFVEDKRLQFRIGVNIGDVVQDGKRIYGEGVNIAARIESLADAGGICISRNTYDHIKNKVQVDTAYLGEHEVKNIKEPVRVYKVLMGTDATKPLVEEKLELPAKPSIAVLPFDNMSGDPSQEYFCDGMAEEIINALTHVERLHVVARTSAFAFKGKSVNVREIAKELNVDNVLEGSVRKAGNRLRITAQLIKVADGYHLWSEKYDRNMEDIFDIQDEISLAIVDNLKVKLLGRKKTPVMKRYTDDLDAYDLYLKGRFYAEMFTPKGFEKAVDCFEKALEIDSNFALAYVELGAVMRYITLMGNISPRVCIPKMRAYAEKALEIDKNLGDAHCLLADYHMNYDWDPPVAEEEFKQALHLNPNSSYIYLYQSLFLLFTERHDDAVAAAKRARDLDPLSSLFNFNVGHILYFAGRYDESIKESQTLLTMNPNYYLPHCTLGYNYRQKNMMNQALAEYEKAYTLSGGVPWSVMILATALYETGKDDRARKLLIQLEERSKHEYIFPLCFYFIHRTFGNSDKASYWLEKAYEEHDGFLGYCRVFPDNTYRIPSDPRLTE